MTAACLLWSAGAHAVEIIPPGAQAKASAGAGQTVSRGSAALFYNPANLIYCRFIQADLDFAIATVKYTYQHPETDKYDPAVINLTVPPVTLGACMRPIPNLSFGVSVMPTGIGTEQKIPDVPLELSQGAIVSSEVSRKVTSMKIAAGGVFRIANALTIGLGTIVDQEKTQILVTRSDQDDPYADALYSGQALQFVLGVRSEILDRALALGFSYKTSATKNYAGDILINIDPETADYQPFEGKGFSPAAIGFGAESRFGSFGLFFDYTREMWSAGRTIFKTGLGNDGDATDFVDTNNIAVGGKLWLGASKHLVEASVGLIEGNVGIGSELPDADAPADEEAENVKGVSFGTIEALPRTVFAAGYRYKLTGSGYLMGAFEMHSGKRTVPEGFGQPGTYTLNIMIASVGLAYGF